MYEFHIKSKMERRQGSIGEVDVRCEEDPSLSVVSVILRFPSPSLLVFLSTSFDIISLVFYLSTWCCFLLLKTWKSVRIVGSSYSVFSFLCPSSHFLSLSSSSSSSPFLCFLFQPSHLLFPHLFSFRSLVVSSFRLYSLTQFSRQRRNRPSCCLLDSRKETMMKWCEADRTSEMGLLFRLSLPFSLALARRQQLSVTR